MINKFRAIAPYLTLLLLTIQVKASDFHSPRTEALGGAGHASPLLGDAIYLNPSFASFMQTHALSINYLTFGGGTINSPSGPQEFYGNNFNISVLDGTSESLFQAGAGFTRRDDSSLIHIGASKSFVKRLGVGIGTKFILPNDASGARIADGSISVSGVLASWFQTAFIVDNLAESAVNRGFYREFTLGTKFNLNSIVLLYIDPHLVPNLPSDQSSFGYEAGIEFPFFSEVFLRLGMFKSSTIAYQAQRGDGYGLGLGWVGPKISIDYSFSRALVPISSISHNFGMTLYF